MMESQVLKDLIVITGVTIPVVILCHRLKISSIIGFLFAGILIGPHGFRLVAGDEEILVFAEFGIVALLFTIGLEFSLKKILRIKTIFLLGGALQVLLTCGASTIIALILHQSLQLSIFIGFLVSLSSTALVLSLLQEEAKIDSPHGRISLAILIFQDIAVVGMILALPLLSGESTAMGVHLMTLAVKLGIVAAIVIAGVKWIVPQVLSRVARTGNREIFLFAILFLCLSIGFLTSSLGLSLALGAFLAGLIISESYYSHRALGSVLPLKDVFSSMFFVSIGMLFDIQFFLARPFMIIFIALSVMLIKAVIAGSTVLVLRWPVNTATLVGISLSQIGEFSFVLMQAGASHNLIGEEFRQVFLGVAMCTLFLTPSAISLASVISAAARKLPLPAYLRGILFKGESLQEKTTLSDHLIIVGYGLVGKNLSRSAKAAQIPYAIIELNPETVEQERKNGEPIYYGDATQEAILDHVQVSAAKVVVIAISDRAAIRGITELVRRKNATTHIIVRIRFMTDVEELLALGADCVIPEEFETSVEIFTRVLKYYLVPAGDIETFTGQVRADGYRMFRTPSLEMNYLRDLLVSNPDISIVPLKIGSPCPLAGKTLIESDLRKRFDVSILAIRRNGETIPNPPGDTRLREDDVIMVMGTTQALTRFESGCALVP